MRTATWAYRYSTLRALLAARARQGCLCGVRHHSYQASPLQTFAQETQPRDTSLWETSFKTDDKQAHQEAALAAGSAPGPAEHQTHVHQWEDPLGENLASETASA